MDPEDFYAFGDEEMASDIIEFERYLRKTYGEGDLADYFEDFGVDEGEGVR